MQLASLPGICWYVTVFLKNLQNFQSAVFDPFVPCAPFLYPLKASENLTVFWCFQGVEKRSISEAWVKDAFTTLFSGTAFLRGNHLKLFGKLILISVNFIFSLCDISPPPLLKHSTSMSNEFQNSWWNLDETFHGWCQTSLTWKLSDIFGTNCSKELFIRTWHVKTLAFWWFQGELKLFNSLKFA